MVTVRPQWPHTVSDIVNSLDGVWGLVGAVGTSGNLLRLERSLHSPVVYTLTEYEMQDETKIVHRTNYPAEQKDVAVRTFAQLLGLQDI